MSKKNVIFIDSRVTAFKTIVTALPSDTDWYLLDRNSNGVSQIQSILANYSGLDSIQIFSRSSVGSIVIGYSELSNQNIADYQNQLAAIGLSLSDTGDIFIFGSNVAQGNVGQAFVLTLANYTGADVVASPAIIVASDSDGKLRIHFGNYASGQSVIQQVDGKLVVAGDSGSDFALVRLNTNGTLDKSFNDHGVVTTNFNDSFGRASSIIQQTDGKLVVAGTTYNPNSSEGSNFALVRYNIDGTLDTTFDLDGKFTTDFNGNFDGASKVIQQTDGKLVVAGYSGTDFALVRYNSNGKLDNSFNGDGKITSIFSNGWYNQSHSIIQQTDGKLVVAGNSADMFVLLRYNTDGSLDSSFGSDGKVTTSLAGSGGGGYSVIQQTDGKLVVAGSAFNNNLNDPSEDFALVRYNTDGTLDTSFNCDGKVTTDFNDGNDAAYSVIQQADGKLVVAGCAVSNNTYGDFGLVRYNSDGTLDTTFDVDGKITTDFNGNDNQAYSVIQQVDGKLVVVGFSGMAAEWDFAIARYNSDGSLDKTFGTENDELIGQAEADYLLGGVGNDTITGLGGVDTINGKEGSDLYIITATADHTAAEIADTGIIGIDEVRFIATTASTLTLYAGDTGIEKVTIGTGTEANAVISATVALNINAAALSYGVSIVGNSGDNRLNGGSSNDSLDGGAGKDTLIGGLGDDIYVVDLMTAAALQDTIIEAASAGTDTLQLRGASTNLTAKTLTLASNLENLDASKTSSSKLNLTGNSVDNILTGNAANNILNGGIGADSLLGGKGNDTYYVDNLGDLVIENANEGTDDVVSSISYTLRSNVENLTLTGNAAINATGNALANTLNGNNGNNILDGGAGNDTLQGAGGNDTYMIDSANDLIIEAVNAGYDTVKVAINAVNGSYTLADNVETSILVNSVDFNLTGNSLANTLTGNSSANVFDGGTGVDTLSGGLGNDTYIVDLTSNALLEDTVTEGTNSGVDTLQLRGLLTKPTFSTVTLAVNLENLDVSLTGLSLLNLTGNGASNLLIGNEADNVLDGGVGADSMFGGAGNDTYVIDNAEDAVYETISQIGNADAGGIDSVKVAISTANGSYSLGNYIENAVLINTVAFSLTGNALNNSLTGNAASNTLNGGNGNDILIGGLGNDTLTGGAGKDVFLFNTAANASTNKDMITDFVSGTDKLQFSKSIFKLGAVGNLTAAEFKSGNFTGGQDATDRIVYNTSTGALYYDADGNGVAGAVQIALIGTATHPSLAYTDIQIIA